MIGSGVNEQLSYLTSNERRILRNYSVSNGSDSDFQTRLARISNPVGGSGEAAKGSAQQDRVRTLLSAIRNGIPFSTARLNG